MKKIRLSQGKFALVDDEDYVRVTAQKWQYAKGYAIGYLRRDGKDTSIKLHQFILNAKKGDIIDHVNGNPLDNRRCNIRFCCSFD